MFCYEKISTVRDLVQAAAAVHKDAPFLRTLEDGKIRDTGFSQFRDACDIVAAWVASRSKQIGHPLRVAMLGPNSCRYVSLLMGVMYGGGVSMPMDPQIPETVLCACLNKAEADLIVHDEAVTLDSRRISESCPGIRQIMTMEQWEQDLTAYSSAGAQLPVSSGDCAAIIFTSGTTGEEKGVMLSNRNLTDSAFNVNYDTPYVKVNILPIHHVLGLNADIIRNFGSSSTTCFNGDVRKLDENIRIFQPTLLNVVPSVAQALYNKIQLLSQKTGRPIQELTGQVFGGRIKKIVAAGAHLSAELVEKYQAMGIFLCQGYGMTECSPSITFPDMNRLDKAHTAGHVVFRCQTRTVDGELQVKSPSVMMGYVNAPELTAQVITPDGWLRTGDIGYEDPEGYVHITGRLKNLIILSNGENVSPEQLENLLMDHRIVEECLVYGEDNCIVAEIFPNAQYAKLNAVTDIPAAVQEVVQTVNRQLPSHKKIMRHRIRAAAFRKTGSRKIIRSQRGSAAEILSVESAEFRKPENTVQQILYDCVAEILAHRNFGSDTDIFTVGADSLGCITLLSLLWERLQLHITLDELMAERTVLKLEQLYRGKQAASGIDYSPRAEYPLSEVQKYFAYSVQGNTTANVPVLFKLDAQVDLPRLSHAIAQLFRVHPILNNRIHMTSQGFVNSRDDSRAVQIPTISLSQEEWDARQNSLVKPYSYGIDNPLHHIALYRVEENKYLLFDVAHIISDGVSLGIMLENLNRLYAGEPVKPEPLSFYEYLLEEAARSAGESRTRDTDYFARLMEGLRIDRSILTRKECRQTAQQKNAALYGALSCAKPDKIAGFSKNVGISENVFFLTAFHYCIRLFRDQRDTVSTSIHNGRTDNRWSRISGCLFQTYNFRCTFTEGKTVAQQLKENAQQIMETMRCAENCMHADEMFFQYQGDLLNFPQIAGHPAQQLPLHLDSLPFHLILAKAETGYRYELRYWENRFDEVLLECFLRLFDAVSEAMVTANTFDEIADTLPSHFFPTAGRWSVIRSDGKRQLWGAWGELCENGSPTGEVGRIMPDGTPDYLRSSGRTVMQEGIVKRSFLDLHTLEQTLESYPGVHRAHAYTYIGSRNVVLLAADVHGEAGVTSLALMKYLREKRLRTLIPAKINVTTQ